MSEFPDCLTNTMTKRYGLRVTTVDDGEGICGTHKLCVGKTYEDAMLGIRRAYREMPQKPMTEDQDYLPQVWVLADEYLPFTATVFDEPPVNVGLASYQWYTTEPVVSAAYDEMKRRVARPVAGRRKLRPYLILVDPYIMEFLLKSQDEPFWFEFEALLKAGASSDIHVVIGMREQAFRRAPAALTAQCEVIR